MFTPCSPAGLAPPRMTSATSARFTAGARSITSFTTNAPMSSGRASISDPLKARPIGVRAVATMTASCMDPSPVRPASIRRLRRRPEGESALSEAPRYPRQRPRHGPGSARGGATVIQESTVLEALENVRILVQPDGGDIEMVSLDQGTGAVNLRLLVEGSNCKECIMPRSILEDIAADVMRRTVPEVATVSIEDPREAPDYVEEAH